MMNYNAILLLDRYLKEHKSTSSRDTYTPTFIAALSTIVKMWNQPKCSSNDELKKMWHLYTRVYFSSIRKNEIMPFVGKLIKLEIILLSQINHSDEDKYCIFTCTGGIYSLKLSDRYKVGFFWV
jgi:hypothetical protein